MLSRSTLKGLRRGRGPLRTILATLAAISLIGVGGVTLGATPAAGVTAPTPSAANPNGVAGNLSGAAATAAAVGAADAGGFNGPTVTHPAVSTESYAAGVVCAFPVRVEFPVNQVVQSTWTNDAGAPVFAIASGLLVARATNMDTGRSTVANLDGTGNYSYLPDGSFILSGGGGVLASMHAGDSPPNELLFSAVSARSFISVRVATVNGKTTKTVLQLSGPHSDLCTVLAPAKS